MLVEYANTMGQTNSPRMGVGDAFFPKLQNCGVNGILLLLMEPSRACLPHSNLENC